MPLIPAVPAQWHFAANPLSVLHARRAVAHALPRDCRPQLADDRAIEAGALISPWKDASSRVPWAVILGSP